jgi:P4 family phage/plasmid primase-like protien
VNEQEWLDFTWKEYKSGLSLKVAPIINGKREWFEGEKEFINKLQTINAFNGEIQLLKDTAPSDRTKELVEEILKEVPNKVQEMKDQTLNTDLEFAFYKDKNRGRAIELLAKRILEYHIITLKDTDEILIFNVKTGLYEKGGETFIANKTQWIMEKFGFGDRVNNGFVSEVIGYIKRSSYTDRHKFEAPPYLIPLDNYVMDIRPDGNGLMCYNPSLHFTSKLPIKYNPNAKCPKFDAFLSEVISNEDYATIWELIGYLFYRDYPIQRTIMFVGSGSNGKSTLIRVLERLIGSKNISYLSLHRLETDKFALSNLYEKYANFFADLSSEELKSTATFKMLTGGDTLTGEQKFKEPFFFKNYAKMVFSCNQIPTSKDDTDAYFRRWIIVSFPNKFDEGTTANPNILDEITTEEELSGILNKAIMYLNQLLKNGRFSGNYDLISMRERYQRLSDSVASFCMDNIMYSTQGYIGKKTIYKEYLNYCGKTHSPSVSEKTFFIRLYKQYNLEEQKKETLNGRERVLVGIRFKTEDEKDE